MGAGGGELTMSGARRIQELLHGKIPMICAMGVRVEDYHGRRPTLCATLDANVNHFSLYRARKHK